MKWGCDAYNHYEVRRRCGVGREFVLVPPGQPAQLSGLSDLSGSRVRVSTGGAPTQIMFGGRLRRGSLRFQSHPSHRIFLCSTGSDAGDFSGPIRGLAAIVADKAKDDHCFHH
jgi:hypothetical protein